MKQFRIPNFGTSDRRNEKAKTLFNTKYPQKPRKTHFWPLESGFSAIATYKTRVFSNAPNSRILKFGILNCFIHTYATAKTDPVANFVELGHVETCSGRKRARQTGETRQTDRQTGKTRQKRKSRTGREGKEEDATERKQKGKERNQLCNDPTMKMTRTKIQPKLVEDVEEEEGFL